MKRISDLLLVVCFSLVIIGCSSNESEPIVPATQAEQFDEQVGNSEGLGTATEDAGDSAVKNDAAETTE